MIALQEPASGESRLRSEHLTKKPDMDDVAPWPDEIGISTMPIDRSVRLHLAGIGE
jgi:hypothetical protein